MLTDSRARFLISAAGLAAASLVKETADREFPASLILTDEIPSPPQAGGEKLPQNSPGQLAYLIYTSGTTGKPRAVGVEHRNVVSLLQHEPFPFRFSSEDTWSLCHSFCFDFSVWELFGCLLSGGRCLVVPREIVTDPRQLLKVIRQYRVTVFNQTPSSFYNVMQECLKHPDPPLPLRYVIFGGESLAARRLAAFHRQFPLVRLINMYGITETTVHVTCKELTSRDLESPLNNIGRPLATLSCYLLDDNLQLVPRGVPGEICISGSQVARGYFGKEALTARKFIPHPLIPGERLYRSGDRGRWLNGDELEYLGRLDQQIQLRGHRIEPAEIEAALLELPEISSAVVVYRSGEAGGGSLSACYVASRELTPEALRRHLQQLLPDYMVPAFFFRIAEIPLTANGKLMPEALPLPAEGKYSRPVYQPPEEGLQQQLSALWEKVLGIGGIGVRDNFFDSGGDSLLIVRLQAELEQLFPGRCRIVDIFNHPTIESLAEFIDSKAESFNLPLLHLPGRFFTAAAQNPYPGYFFLEPALSLNLRNLAAQRGLSPGRLLLEAFLRLLAGLSEEERFPVQTALHQPGRGSCLYADPAGNGGELALSAGSSAGEYALPELAQLPLLREKNRALVLFYKQGCLTGFEYLLPCFDLALGFQIRQQQTGFRLQHSQRIAAGSAAELAAGYQQACGSLLQTAATADRRL